MELLRNILHLDRGTLSPVRRDPESGFMYFDGRATRVGIFPYRDENGGIRRELRPAEEVGSPLSLKTLARKAVTKLHPRVFVDSTNSKEFAVGLLDDLVVWEQDFEDGFVRVKGVVQHQDAIEAIESGKMRELSCGYRADVEMNPGVWTDFAGKQHRYDAIQRNIRYNHLALVPRGRAGREAALRVDGLDESFVFLDDEHVDELDRQWLTWWAVNRLNMTLDQVMKIDEVDLLGFYEVEQAKQAEPRTTSGDPRSRNFSGHRFDDTHNKRETPMKIRIDGREYDLANEPTAAQRAITDLEKSRDDAVAKFTAADDVITAVKAERDTATGEVTTASARADVAEAELKKLKEAKPKVDSDDANAYGNQRIALVLQARELKLDGFDELAGISLTNAEIKRAIVLDHLGEEAAPKLDDATYVNAAFDLIASSKLGEKKNDAGAQKTDAFGTKIVDAKNDRHEPKFDDLDALQRKFDDERRDMWKEDSPTNAKAN